MKIEKFLLELANKKITENDVIVFRDKHGDRHECNVILFLRNFEIFKCTDIEVKNDFKQSEKYVYIYYDEKSLFKNNFSILAHVISTFSWEDTVKEFSIPESCVLYKSEKL